MAQRSYHEDNPAILGEDDDHTLRPRPEPFFKRHQRISVAIVAIVGLLFILLSAIYVMNRKTPDPVPEYPDNMLDRFLAMIAIDTRSDEDSGLHPSSSNQWDLSDYLAGEMRALGFDTTVSDIGVVTASLPASSGALPTAPTIAFLAHMDTTPEIQSLTGPAYQFTYELDGPETSTDGSVVLPVGGVTIPAASLAGLEGQRIIASDGSGCLGADDKAGIAIIVTAASRLLDEDLVRPAMKFVFTVDEEVGEGADGVDVDALGASLAYTFDGSAISEIENANFNADGFTLTFAGVNTHAGSAYHSMVSAVRMASSTVACLDITMGPEESKDMDPYIFPNTIKDCTVQECTVTGLLRTFDEDQLQDLADQVTTCAEAAAQQFGGEYTLDVYEQYRNMAEVLDAHPDVTEAAVDVLEGLGVDVELAAIRGGTDGARLSWRGLPCPNLGTSGRLFHSNNEFAVLEEMELGVEAMIGLAEYWANHEYV
eukprot:gnl/Dysnectes_brevis/795_a876_2561.p1 GENE.gnl/Dysnectes_brevis/795_a876_2561~~gnl/Dysnectes_brevis/795_a876_2561.p1  ORF type:complete len:494 (+),score=141.85 gnl/Dysnectes_brevis/795_a876_2561:35-1483(+)